MNESKSQFGQDESWLDALLRADAAGEGHIDDDGFCERVMDGLPPRRSRRWTAWLAPTLGIVGGCAVFLGLGLPGVDQLFIPLFATAQITVDPESLLRAALPLLGIGGALAAAGFLTLAEDH